MNKKNIFYYTKRNIIIISTAIVFLCLFIFAMIVQFFYSSRLYNDIDRLLLQQKRIIGPITAFILDEKNGSSNQNPFPPRPMPIIPNLIVSVYEGSEIKFISMNPYFDKSSYPALSDISDDKAETIQFNGYNFRGIRYINNEYTIQLLINVDSEKQSIKQLSNSIILSLVILIIIALVLSAFLASKIIKPVKSAYDKQVYFVQDASHEMRTPLAVIKGKLEILANSWGKTIDDNFEHISKMMSEVRGLEKLNTDLLLLTKEDIGFFTNIKKFTLNEFIDDISDFYLELAEIQDKVFNVIKPKSNITIHWDYDKTKRSVVILLENAFKYTPSRGKISLSFEEAGKNIKIIVSDTGIGIKEEDQSRIFDRFFRSSDVRAKNINGSGIGLSLLKSISKTLGIMIRFSSQYNAGTEFELLVPKIMK